MVPRTIRPSATFEKDLKHLSKKHRDLEDTITKTLNEIAAKDTPLGDRIPGLDGAPVYKLRVPLGSKGKRGGARLVYYCDESRVVPLFVYAKNELGDIPALEIREALKSTGLLPSN